MPVPNIGQRGAANWEKVVGTKPTDNINQDYWLFNQFSEGDGFMGVNGGDKIVVPVEYALNSTASSYSDTDTINTTRVDVFDRFEFDWKELVVTVVMSKLEEDRNEGDGRVFALLPAKLENAKNSMRALINTQLFGDGTGNSGKDLGGLQSLVSSTPTTGLVGTINRANFAFARNNQVTGTKTTSAFDNLRAAMRTGYNLGSNGGSGDHPTGIVTDRATFEGFEGLLLANERFDGKADGDGGFKNEVLKFKGARISYDNACPAGTMYEFNPKYLKLVYKKGSWFKMLTDREPTNQTITVTPIRTMCNLIVTAPRRLSVITAIN